MTDYRKLADTILHLRSWGGLKDVDAMTMDEWKAVDTALRLCADRSAPASSSLALTISGSMALAAEIEAELNQPTAGAEGVWYCVADDKPCPTAEGCSAGQCGKYGQPAVEKVRRLARLAHRAAEVLKSAATPAATARFESDITTVRLLLDGFKDETPIKEVRAMLDRQFGAPTDTAFRIRSANPINDAAPGVSAQGASDGQEGLMGDGPNPPSAAVAASPSSTPPASARAEAEQACEYSACVGHDLSKARCDHCPIESLKSPPTTGKSDLEILKMALGNTAAMLGDVLAIYNKIVGEEVFKNADTSSATPRADSE